MDTQKEEIVGELEITLFKGKKFSLNTNYKQESVEIYFVLFMIDRILFDLEDMDHKQSISSMLARYISNQRNEREKLKKFFNNYEKSSDLSKQVIFSVTHKLFKSIANKGTMFRMETARIPDKVSNFDGKISISTMLYVIDLISRFPVENQKFISDAFTAMLKEYSVRGFPTDKTLSEVPLKALITASSSRKG